MNNTFKSDLAFGNKYEQLLLDVVAYDKYKIKQGYFPWYDVKIYLNDKVQKFEVKADRYAYKTNQICIEYEYNDKPSGITKTKADIYAYFIVKPNTEEYELYFIPVKRIKQKITEELYTRNINGGFEKKSKLYIFDLKHFEKYKVKL